MAKKIIDVSVHNGTINWDIAKEEIDGAILRCGYGDNLAAQDDRQYARNLAECERLGIPHGVYLYSYARSEAQAMSELAHVLRLVKGHEFQLPIFIDVEENGTQTFAHRTCEVVCSGLREAGYGAGVYSSTSWWNNYLTTVTDYARWVAQWADYCTYSGNKIMWQYTESGHVNGINGNVDMNWYYGNIGILKPNAAPKKTDREIAVEVLMGKWGNGAERKKKLETAGYRYNDIQRAVNELVTATKKKSVTELAKEVVGGKWGNGAERKTRLEAAGYSYEKVQEEVNKIVNRTPKKTNVEIAKEIIAGKWGNGEDRKKRLAAAGYDYTAIQTEVNKMAR